MRFARLFAIALYTLTLSVSSADEREFPGLVVGESAVVSGVRFASGEWFKVSKYTCPVAARGREPKVAIYTAVLDEHVLRLAQEVERMIEKDDSLKWSFRRDPGQERVAGLFRTVQGATRETPEAGQGDRSQDEDQTADVRRGRSHGET